MTPEIISSAKVGGANTSLPWKSEHPCSGGVSSHPGCGRLAKVFQAALQSRTHRRTSSCGDPQHTRPRLLRKRGSGPCIGAPGHMRAFARGDVGPVPSAARRCSRPVCHPHAESTEQMSTKLERNTPEFHQLGTMNLENLAQTGADLGTDSAHGAWPMMRAIRF